MERIGILSSMDEPLRVVLSLIAGLTVSHARDVLDNKHGDNGALAILWYNL